MLPIQVAVGQRDIDSTDANMQDSGISAAGTKSAGQWHQIYRYKPAYVLRHKGNNRQFSIPDRNIHAVCSALCWPLVIIGRVVRVASHGGQLMSVRETFCHVPAYD